MRYVLDGATSAYADDIKSNAPSSIHTHQDVVNENVVEQADDNYAYDEIGNLVKDTKEGISNITWNVYGKIQSITKATGTISYTYDAGGNRISKTAGGTTTIYLRDASGNVMSVYTKGGSSSTPGNLTQSEVHLYGSSRLGIFEVKRDVQTLAAANYLNNINTFTRGNKFFELSNHLGNVLATVSDKKTGNDPNHTGFVKYYSADVVTANDYYPGGMLMPGRKYSAQGLYRYGFNGKENDNDVKGEGNEQDYGLRIYDLRLSRFLSVDPLFQTYPWNSTYAFAENKPINCIDLDGGEAYWYKINMDAATGNTKITYVDTKTSWLDPFVPNHLVVSINGGPFQYFQDFTNNEIKSGQMKAALQWIARNPIQAQSKINGNIARAQADKEKSAEETKQMFIDAFTVAWAVKSSKLASSTKEKLIKNDVSRIRVTEQSVNEKLSTYLLDETHPRGRDKAIWFKEALGYTKENMGDLARQIKFDPVAAVFQKNNGYGNLYQQIISIKGANDKIINTAFNWIIKDGSTIPELVGAIPGKKGK